MSAPGLVGRVVLGVVALGCVVAAVLWFRSARRLGRSAKRLDRDAAARGTGQEAAQVARVAYHKELHTALLYALLAFGATLVAAFRSIVLTVPFLVILIPVVLSFVYGRRFGATATLVEERAELERRAEEVLAQEELAPMAWAARLAPAELPSIQGFEIGQVYQPGTGVMAGDFYDLTATGPARLAAVIGDVSGHGIEPSITAFQVKYLLRVFLRQYRDPGQAIEELNVILSAQGRAEDLVSLCAVVLDQVAGTLRFASAGHPAAWLWHRGEVRSLRATGPLLTLDPKASYFSQELPLDPGDFLLLYTDGLAEARSGQQLFGEDRVASYLRRDPGQDPSILCKVLLEAARDFSSGPLGDDLAILAIKKM
jgi:serine phosphatase RsbU (regulator of sigma subunit)